MCKVVLRIAPRPSNLFRFLRELADFPIHDLDQLEDAASTLAFLTSTPEFGSDWAAQSGETLGRVTLLGDAAHPMPPVGMYRRA